MVEPEDPLGDDEPHPRLLPPDDRLWRHPSEVAGHGAPRSTAGQSRHRLPVWFVATTAGVVGAFLTLGVMAATGNLHRILRVPVVEQVTPPGNSVPATGTAVLARQLQPAVVHLEVQTGGSGTARGAGVMFRSDGHLLTNNHVVANATKVVVIAADGTRALARVVAADEWSDLAVVKIEGDNLAMPVAVMGSAAGLVAAQEVIAIGGLGGSTGGGPAVDVGTIGALGQEVVREDGISLLDMIRTDMPVPADASGGALFDRSGALVGILTALTPAGATGAQSGYATPIDWARRVADELLATGRVARVWMGIEGDSLPADMAATLGVPGGVLVEDLREGSPALSAVAPDDIITAVDDKPVDSMRALRVELRYHRPGDVITLRLVHNTAVRMAKVTLAERPAQI